MRSWIACSLIVAWHGSTGAPAWGQAADLPARTDVAGARPQPEFAPLNVRLRSWTAAPQLILDQGYDSNLFDLPQGRVGDGYAMLSPSITMATDWSRHGLEATARSTLTRYAHHERQNSDEYALAGRARIDLPEATVTLSQSWNRTAERRGVNGIPLSLASPSIYRSSTQALDAKADRGRFSAGVRVAHRKFAYSDLEQLGGGKTSQSFRDSEGWTLEGGVDAAPRPDVAVGLAFRYAQASVPLVPERNSHSLAVEGSLAMDLGLWRTNIVIGWLDQHFAAARFRDYRGLTYRQTVEWYPTTLVTARLAVSHGLEESGDPAAGVATTLSVRGGLDYELLRNLVLRADHGWRRQRFRETGRQLVSREFGLEGEYSFNRSVSFGAYARRECRDSSGLNTQKGFCASLLGMTLKLRR